MGCCADPPGGPRAAPYDWERYFPGQAYVYSSYQLHARGTYVPLSYSFIIIIYIDIACYTFSITHQIANRSSLVTLHNFSSEN